jgi:hypothetical protein
MSRIPNHEAINALAAKLLDLTSPESKKIKDAVMMVASTANITRQVLLLAANSGCYFPYPQGLMEQVKAANLLHALPIEVMDAKDSTPELMERMGVNDPEGYRLPIFSTIKEGVPTQFDIVVAY